MNRELLHRAADVLRHAAREAESGPWGAELTGNGSAWVNLEYVNHAFTFHGFPDSADYVALVHPPVAAAVADWLDAEAQLYAPNISAFAVARAILRESS